MSHNIRERATAPSHRAAGSMPRASALRRTPVSSPPTLHTAAWAAPDQGGRWLSVARHCRCVIRLYNRFMGQKLVSPATYWRRRVVALAAGLAVLGLPIWAVNQALGGSRAPGQGSPRSYASDVTRPSASPRAGRGHRQAPG